MGVSNFDKEGKSRNYENTYNLVTPKGVEEFLREYWAIDSRRFLGDTAASDLLVDMQRAIKDAGLSPMQSKVLNLLIFEDYTQQEASRTLGIAQQNVGKHFKRAIVKIAEIYEYWAWHGEGYELTVDVIEEIQQSAEEAI